MAWDWNDILSGYWQEVDADGSGEVDTAVFFGGVGRLPSSLDPCLLQFLANLLGFYCGDQIFSKSERERESSIGVCWRSYTVIPGPSVYVVPSQKYVSLDGSWRCASWEGGSWRHTETPPIVWWESPVWSTFFFSRYLYAICTVENHNNMIWYHSISFYCNSYIDDHWCIVLHCDMFKYLNLSTFKYLNLSTLYVYICMYVCVCVFIGDTSIVNRQFQSKLSATPQEALQVSFREFLYWMLTKGLGWHFKIKRPFKAIARNRRNHGVPWRSIAWPEIWNHPTRRIFVGFRRLLA